MRAEILLKYDEKERLLAKASRKSPARSVLNRVAPRVLDERISTEESFDPARSTARRGNMSVQTAEIQEMLFDRLEIRSISFLMTQ